MKKQNKGKLKRLKKQSAKLLKRREKTERMIRKFHKEINPLFKEIHCSYDVQRIHSELSNLLFYEFTPNTEFMLYVYSALGFENFPSDNPISRTRALLQYLRKVASEMKQEEISRLRKILPNGFIHIASEKREELIKEYAANKAEIIKSF